jgi:hypothetical protein
LIVTDKPLQDPVGVLRVATDDLLRVLFAVRGRPHGHEEVNDALLGFTRRAEPIQHALAERAAADSNGALATALAHLRRAFGHLAVDDLDAGRSELAAARGLLAPLTPATEFGHGNRGDNGDGR